MAKPRVKAKTQRKPATKKTAAATTTSTSSSTRKTRSTQSKVTKKPRATKKPEQQKEIKPKTNKRQSKKKIQESTDATDDVLIKIVNEIEETSTKPVANSTTITTDTTAITDTTTPTTSTITNFNLSAYLTSKQWSNYLNDQFNEDYFKQLNTFLNAEYNKKTIFPKIEDIFNAFNLTDLDKIKVVIVGQDPYHDDGQAHGLAFSVQKGIDVPRSLKNIYTELQNDITGFKSVNHGDLTEWAKDGVFLLNTILTVEAHKPGSHQKAGWLKFTDRVIQLISEHNNYCVFILWGKVAHVKESLIDAKKHGIIKCAHPSPLSFNKFLNSKCFSQANNLLTKNGKSPVNWLLTE